ncbi:hypothetical protein BN1708_018700, partial [Verticillium longisporum]
QQQLGCLCLRADPRVAGRSHHGPPLLRGPRHLRRV